MININKDRKKVLGEIKNSDKIAEIVQSISNSKQYGNLCLSDGHSFDFEMYDENNQKYYLCCFKSDKVMIKFMTENNVMTLKYALTNSYISADVVVEDYPRYIDKEK